MSISVQSNRGQTRFLLCQGAIRESSVGASSEPYCIAGGAEVVEFRRFPATSTLFGIKVPPMDAASMCNIG